MLPARTRGADVALIGVAALAVAGLLALAGSGWGPLLHHGPAAGGHGAHAPAALAGAAWLLGWGLMVAATMLPGSAPLVRRTGSRGFAAAGFLLVWALTGLAVLAGVAAAGALGFSPALAGGAALAAAGAYQLSGPKRRALRRCRDHAGRTPAPSGRDPSGDALRAGLGQGVASAACCGPLMAALAFQGTGGVVAMLLAGGVMAAEAAAPWGTRITRPAGALLLAAGALVVLLG